MPKARQVAKVVTAALAVGLAGFVGWPSPIDPAAVAVQASDPLEGPWQPNDALHPSQWLGAGEIPGPEDVAFGEDGSVYAGTADGRIVRIHPNRAGARPQTIAQTGGRPLGLDVAPDGSLVVADGRRGLLSVQLDGTVSLLADAADGVPFGFTNDVDVSRGAVAYFTDASSRWTVGEYVYDLMEGRPHGRLLRFDPERGEPEVLLGGLFFANGVALAPDESFVLVNETYQYRVRKYWLAGELAGTSEVIVDGLPGFPDGVSCDERGRYWLAMFTVRNPAASWLAPRPWARALIMKLPAALWPKPARYGLIAELDGEGTVRRTLQDPDGSRVFNVTSAEVHDGWLYAGTLMGDRISRVRVD